MELDHIFLRTSAGAPEAALLLELGLTEGSANQHPGQGTANRRFFFNNAFLELLWIAHPAEVSNAATSPTQLAQRLAPEQTASPFGLCFRPSGAGSTPPFPSWPYRPAYLPAGMQVDIASNTPLHEPMWFYLAQAVPPAQAVAARRQPLQHALGVHDITAVTLTVATDTDWSPAAQAAGASAGITLKRGTCHLLELGFDHGAQGRSIDLRPTLPLLLHL
ncbi:glyoxalase-like domain protein [Pseudoduganella sp. FT93W]|uniref:Glyoxalase-like domain protein n=1 Tax=Duganella fentianensis TaxID=2692177 RepID=A0A845HV74_9BURK|nr:glyoxalase-like domain protein [Duganella fentianensis]